MSTSASDQPIRERISLMKRPRWFFFYAVAMPLLTLGFEMATHACGSAFFDPAPTWMHALLIAMVPAANLATWLVLNKQSNFPFRLLRTVRGAAWLISTLYLYALGPITVFALLLLPFSVFAIPSTFGLGVLLPLTALGPFTGWLGLLTSASTLRSCGLVDDASRSRCTGWFAAGAAAALVIFAIAETPYAITQSVLVSSDVFEFSTNESRAQHRTAAPLSPAAIQRLRIWGKESALREMCYRGGILGSSLSVSTHLMAGGGLPMGLSNRRPTLMTPETARECYYKVYGRSFSEAPPVRRTPFDLPFGRNRNNDGDINEGWQWDGDVAGDDVGARIRGLSLQSSRMDWHLDSSSQLAYGEWTLEFRNRHTNPQEARCQILLPSGGCVSRLTLWVNGEEREAAFGGKAAVKAAYRQVVVVERRDPVLVNMVGPDRVMTQCFPVPPGGTMKVRLGISAPLDGVAKGTLTMPQFIERNFTISPEIRHSLWVQADRSFVNGPADASSRPDGSQHAWQASLSEQDVRRVRIKLADEPKPPTSVWTEDGFAEAEQRFVTRTVKTTQRPGAKSLIIVIDASAGLVGHAEQIRDAVEKAASSVAAIVISTDEGFREIKVDEIRRSLFVGGRDAAPALMRAAELARDRGAADTPIVWLHGVQPISFPRSTGLEQLLERAAVPPRFVTVGLASGPNRLLEKLYAHSTVETLGRFDDSANDLTALLSELARPASFTVHEYQRASAAPSDPASSRVWDQLSRYAVFENVLAEFKGTSRAEKVLADRAAKYQLVTPVSGAVVLETQQQYDRAGLKPGDPNASPQIPKGAAPEPARTILLLIGAGAMVFRRRRRHSALPFTG